MDPWVSWLFCFVLIRWQGNIRSPCCVKGVVGNRLDEGITVDSQKIVIPIALAKKEMFYLAANIGFSCRIGQY